MSPDCFPWGQPSRSWARERREQARQPQRLTLRCLAVLCLGQLLFGRSYFSEQPKGSDMYKDSSMKELTYHGLPYCLVHLDQCACGAHVEQQAVLKSAELRSNVTIPAELTRKCPTNHDHYLLRGATADGRRATAISCMYSDDLCKALLHTLAVTHGTTRGGRAHLNKSETRSWLKGGLKKTSQRQAETSRAKWSPP